MDAVFQVFIEWYLEKKPAWEQAGVSVARAGFGPYGHKYWIELFSEHGLGNIFLYESNGMYWVDFEGGNDPEDMYVKAGISFDTVNVLDPYADELITYMR